MTHIKHLFYTLAAPTVLAISFLYAQDITTWMRAYGGAGTDVAESVQQTSDGGYIFAGYTNSGRPDDDFWLVKTDANGDTIRTKTYGGSDDDNAYAVQQTTDGGYILVGVTRSFGAGSIDAWLVKTDANGDTIWTKTYGGSGVDQIYSGQQTTDSGYIIAGSTSSSGANTMDAWLVKTDSLGNTLWSKMYGGGDWEGAESVQQTIDGGYIFAGWTYTYGPGYQAFWLVKTDSMGAATWSKTYGGDDHDFATYVRQTSDGGYILSGHADGTPGYAQGKAWLIRTDAVGDTLWTRKYGNRISVIEQVFDSGFLLVGGGENYANGTDAWLARLDTAGNVIWTKLYGGREGDFAKSAQLTADGGFIIAGMTLSFGAGSWDALLIKTDSAGNTIPLGTSGYNPYSIPNKFHLHPAYPNPFNPATTIRYDLPHAAPVTLTIYDLLGREVTTLVEAYTQPGAHEAIWDAGSLPSGIYIARLITPEFSKSIKMVLMK
ncbi:T9SS type A sorting domain-containing protein [Candidatus Neomarinimicrobiota bacterium]